PERRYVTAAALADDLRRLEEGRPIQARPVGWPERFWRWCRRKPAAAALIATALVSVGLALAGVRWLEQQQAERRAGAARRGDRAGAGGDPGEGGPLAGGAGGPGSGAHRARQPGPGQPPRTTASGARRCRHGDQTGGDPAAAF